MFTVRLTQCTSISSLRNEVQIGVTLYATGEPKGYFDPGDDQLAANVYDNNFH